LAWSAVHPKPRRLEGKSSDDPGRIPPWSPSHPAAIVPLTRDPTGRRKSGLEWGEEGGDKSNATKSKETSDANDENETRRRRGERGRSGRHPTNVARSTHGPKDDRKSLLDGSLPSPSASAIDPGIGENRASRPLRRPRARCRSVGTKVGDHLEGIPTVDCFCSTYLR